MALSRNQRPSEVVFDEVQVSLSRLNNIVWLGSAQHLTEIENHVAVMKGQLNLLVKLFHTEHEDQFPPKELPDSALINKQDQKYLDEQPLADGD